MGLSKIVQDALDLFSGSEIVDSFDYDFIPKTSYVSERDVAGLKEKIASHDYLDGLR